MRTKKVATGGLAALIVVNLIWAGSFPATSIAVRHLSALLLTTVRLGVASVILLPLLRLPAPLRWDRKTIGMCAILGFLGFTAPVYLETEGLALSTPAMAAVSIALEPLFTALIAAVMLRERIPGNRRFALLIAMIGAWAIAGFPRPGTPGYAAGDVLLVVSVICYGLYSVYSKRLTVRIPSHSAAAATLLAGFLTSLPVWLLTGHAWPRSLPASGYVSVLYLALFASAGAYLLWLYALESFRASVAALFLYLQPVFGVILSILIVGVRPPTYFYLGGGLILLGLFVGREKSLEARAS